MENSDKLSPLIKQLGVLFRTQEAKDVIPHLVELIPDEPQMAFYSKYDTTRKMDYAGSDIELRFSSYSSLIRVNACKKEPFTVEWIEQKIRPGDTFFDIGANVGPYSLIASKFFRGEVKIFAFEPSFSNFADLCWNVIRNKCAESIVPVPIALSSQSGFANLIHSNLESGAALHELDSNGSTHKDKAQPVLTMTLDDFCTVFKAPVPNHIKLDVDGSEFEVLKGGMKVLEDERLRSMIIEIDDRNQETLPKIEGLLNEHSFRVVSHHRRQKPGAPLYCVFERRARSRQETEESPSEGL
jgi:FkbM family methyltransferase